MPADFHPSDRALLQAADGELSSRRAGEIRAHLEGCSNCRARMAQLEETAAEFARVHRETLDSQLPPIAGSRAELRVRLAQLAEEQKRGSWRQFFRIPSAGRAAAYACLMLLAAGVAGEFFMKYSGSRAPVPAAVSVPRGVIPDRRLTPGATRQVSLADVCSMAHEEVVREVPAKLRGEIFQEYGIVNPQPADFEIDYLIAPGLGGTEDIHNLWPEPYTTAVWNAHVKDALEEQLHEMVCAGKLDLTTAQNDIASDWVAAYKKYFHTENPLAPRSRVNPFPDCCTAVYVLSGKLLTRAGNEYGTIVEEFEPRLARPVSPKANSRKAG